MPVQIPAEVFSLRNLRQQLVRVSQPRTGGSVGRITLSQHLILWEKEKKVQTNPEKVKLITLVSVLTSLLPAVSCFQKYVWMGKKKHLFLCTQISNFDPKVASPRASSSVRASVMYLKSMQDTICLGSWNITPDWVFAPWSHDPGHKSNMPCDSPCQQAASTAATGKMKRTLCELWSCGGNVLITLAQPCPLLWPTGPTQHSGLQHWPGGSLPSLDLAGPHSQC